LNFSFVRINLSGVPSIPYENTDTTQEETAAYASQPMEQVISFILADFDPDGGTTVAITVS
jgi:hypothetical protein